MIRWKGYLDWVLSTYARKEIKRDLRRMLSISLYQIAFMKKGDYHVVNETVDYVKREKGQATANFVNAMLRRFIREKDSGSFSKEEALSRSFPAWLVKRWQSRFGDSDTAKLLSILNETPRFTLRVNLSRLSLEQAATRLFEEGIPTQPGQLSASALSVDKLAPVLVSRLFAEGIVSVQDEMSQLAGFAAAKATSTRILDACAGLGTKSRQIREICPHVLVVSMDNEMKRLGRAGTDCIRVLADATRSPFKKDVFDTILLDAPCSSLGVLRKHPEIKWRRHREDIISFGNYQLSLLSNLWQNLARGGHMIYSVCSFEPEETLDVIEKFKKAGKFTLENPLPFLFNKEYYLSLPHETGTDGFFIAKMKKT